MAFSPKVRLLSGQTSNEDYTPNGAVSAGDVIVSQSGAYFAQNDIAASALGAVAAEGGIWRGVKGSGAITGGVDIYWDSSNAVFTATSSGNTYVGVAVLAGAASGDTTVDFVFKGKISP